MLSRSLKNGLTGSSGDKNNKNNNNNNNNNKNNNNQNTLRHGTTEHNNQNIRTPWISRSISTYSSTSSSNSSALISDDMDDEEDEEDNNLLYFKPKKIYNLDSHPQETKDINSVKNEYVPDLNFNNIVKKWEVEEYLDKQEKNSSNREETAISPSSRLLNESGLALNDKSKHSQVEPIPLPSLKNSITAPSTLELERRASYMNLLTSNNPASSVKNTFRQTVNPLIQKHTSPFIPRSRRPSSLRGFPSPVNIPHVIGLDALTPLSRNSNNNGDKNNNGASLGQSNITAPLPSIPTDTTIASKDVSMSNTSRSLDEASFSSTSSSQLRYGATTTNVSTIPIDIAANKLRDEHDIFNQYFNNIAMDKDEFFGLIKLLPSDFLNLPYSQRKAKILDILPRDKLSSYKDIMSLIKKVSLTTSKSNTSLGSCNIDIPGSGNSIAGFNNKNNTNNNPRNSLGHNNNGDINFANKSGLSLHRHNSVASQYLSTFSPSSTSLLSLNNNNDMSSSLNSKFVRPSEKGMQLFNYTLGGIVGFGAWGMIRKCKNNNDGSLKAVKVIKFRNDEKIKERVLREINIWNQLRHNNILPLIDYQIDNDYAMYCLTELVQDGTLYDLVLSWDNFSSVEISNDTRCKIVILLIRQVLDALKYLHEQMKVIHGDIKLENCLLDKNSKHSLPRDWKVILCDFGMSYSISDCYLKKNDSQVGSLPYASPELLTENKLNEKSDIWAFGVMLYTMLIGKLPFKHPTESLLRDLIKAGKYDQHALCEVCSDQYKELTEIVAGCLTVDLKRRWDLETIQDKLELLYHKCFQVEQS